MSATYSITVGNKGRIVVPAAVRERVGLTEGTVMVLMDTPGGLALLTREQLRDRIRADLAGLDLVSELLHERRRAAHGEDAA